MKSLDVLSVPATYEEPKGMFLLEAMACGVPVIQPHRGAFVEIVERTSGGMLVAADDPDALADAFDRVRQSPELAARLSEDGFRKVRQHYSIEVAAARLLEVYESLLRPAMRG